MAEGMMVELAERVLAALQRRGEQLVVVESCTCGLIAATLGSVPGASTALRGGWVVYQNAAKQLWLGVPPEILDAPGPGPVSSQVTSLLATQSLDRSPGCRWALAITGHLGPDAPPALDGVVYTAIATHRSAATDDRQWRLLSPCPDRRAGAALCQQQRAARQCEAVQRALEHLATQLHR
jgi:nicotinamide-nucleotide amidase